jgi:catechol 2,3-dioxygenase-like lactoylglutathione lyase family enzyme
MPRMMKLAMLTASFAVIAAAVSLIHAQEKPKQEPIMGLEHLGLNVPDVKSVVQWFVDNLDMKVARKTGDPSNAHFLMDAAGTMMLEVYHNTGAPVPDYAARDPLELHIAFRVEDVAAARARLIAAGATPLGEITRTAAGDYLAMMRTPHGIAIQLAKREKRMVD